MTSIDGVAAEPATAEPTVALQLWVCIAGHRDIDQELVRPALAWTFETLANAFSDVASYVPDKHSGETILEAHQAIWPSRTLPAGMTLMSGYAKGTDRLAVELWQQAGLGRVHAVFPYGDPSDVDAFAWTDRPDPRAEELKVAIPRPADASHDFDAVTMLDGTTSGMEHPPRNAHLDQTRWLIRWSDLAIAIWDGKSAGGPGGTADFVSLAIANQLPIIWIDVSGSRPDCRLIQPGIGWHEDFFSEAIAALDDLNDREAVAPILKRDDTLARLLIRQLAPPAPQHTGHHGRSAPDIRRHYTKNTRLAEGTGPKMAGRFPRLKRAMASTWRGFYKSLGTAATPPDIVWPADSQPPAVIARAYAVADREASFLGDFHRACQALILLLAVFAVVAGTAPAAWPEVKLEAVSTEILLIFCATMLLGYLKRGYIHVLWSDTRQLAEQLRVLAASWPMGFSAIDERNDTPQTWMEWQVRAIRRAIGPPVGFMSRARRQRTMRFAREDPYGIVEGQRLYHEITEARMRKLHRAIEHTEIALGYFLLLCLASFLIYYVAHHHVGWPKPAHWISGLLLMLSAVIPAIAAGALAIEAKIGIGEAQQRSAHLKQRFKKIADDMKAVNGAAKEEQLLREAGRLLISDIDMWHDGEVRRVAQQI